MEIMSEDEWNMEDFKASISGEIDLEQQEVSNEIEEVETEQETIEDDQPDVSEDVSQGESTDTPVEEVEETVEETVEKANPYEEQLRKQQEIIDQLNKKMDSVVEYNSSKQQEAYDAEMEALLREKWDRVNYGDIKGVQEIEEKITNLQQKGLTQKEEPVKVENKEEPQFVKDFISENSWMNTDEELTARMVAEAEFICRSTKTNLNPEILAQAKANVKKLYAHKFENPKKKEVAPVVTKTPVAKKRTKSSMSDLTPAERQVYRAMSKHMTLEEYIKGLE